MLESPFGVEAADISLLSIGAEVAPAVESAVAIHSYAPVHFPSPLSRPQRPSCFGFGPQHAKSYWRLP